ncbi:MAG: restriction endonuclease [Oscillospiraceae bacterium]|nr:restriction endonuclease [Oscillospiraceae bacterium]
MECDANPYRDLPISISPVEFEKFCMETLKAYAAEESLQNFVIKHNQKVETYDSTYQIDVLAEYTALGCKNIVVIECKKYSRNVERAVVAELYSKLQSMGAQKGILISTSGFQSDAVKFAKQHGIALWQVCDRSIKHYSAAASREIPPHILFQLKMEEFLPKFIMMEWDCNADYPYNELYPTSEMYSNARSQAREALAKERR